MDFNKNGVKHIPLKTFTLFNSHILSVYQGSLSELDLLVKFRIYNNSKWSRQRTPKHIHWAVDILIKMSHNKSLTREFLKIFNELWEATKPHKTFEERDDMLKVIEFDMNILNKFNDLNKFGDYNIQFLILLAKILMQQEKNNYPGAFMFKKLLDALVKGEDIHKIVSIATQNGRKK
jgi:hypothetical protein